MESQSCDPINRSRPWAGVGCWIQILKLEQARNFMSFYKSTCASMQMYIYKAVNCSPVGNSEKLRNNWVLTSGFLVLLIKGPYATIPAPLGRRPWPVRNQAAQHEVNRGPARKTSLPLLPDRLSSAFCPSPPSHVWKNCLPRNRSLVPKSLGTTIINDVISN